MDETEDFEITGSQVKAFELVKKTDGLLKSLIRDDDKIVKKGRRLLFHLRGARRAEIPLTSLTVGADNAFTLELRRGDERFAEAEVDQRARQALDSLASKMNGVKQDQVLVLAVMPQYKKLLGFQTPVRVEFIGMPFYLRFLIALFKTSRIRLFAVGPFIHEIDFD